SMTNRFYLLVHLVLFVLFLAGCGQVPAPTTIPPAATVSTGVTAASTVVTTATATTAPTVEVPPTPSPTATPAPWRVAAAPGLPEELIAAAQEIVTAHSDQFAWAEEPEGADMLLRLAPLGEGNALATWVYAVAVPFATVADGVTLAELQASWRGEGGPPLLLTPDTEALLRQLWGEGRAE